MMMNWERNPDKTVIFKDPRICLSAHCSVNGKCKSYQTMSRLIKVELTKAVVIVQATYGQIKPSSGKNGTKSLILSLTMFEYPICSNPKSLPEVKKLSTRENTFYNYQISAVNY